MLVLTRRLNESIMIGEDIEIKIVQVKGSGDQAVIRVGISAPRHVTVLRKEVYDEVVAANQQAVHAEVTIPTELLEAARGSTGRAGRPQPEEEAETDT